MNHEIRRQEDIEAILRIALEDADRPRSDGNWEVDLREQLNQAGRELGLEPEAIQAAEATWQARKEAQELAEFQRIRRFYFMAHLTSYALIGVFFVVLALNGYLDQTLTGLLLCLGGVGLFFHRNDALNKESESFKKGLQHFRELQKGD